MPAVLPLLLLAFLYRLAFLLLVPRVLDSADSVHYAETARLFLSGEFFGHNPKIPIFYPLLGAFFSLFTRDPEWGCRLASFVFSTMTVLPVYAIARRLHGARAAWWAGLTVALWPWLADYACAVSTEATAVFLWMTGFWLLLRVSMFSELIQERDEDEERSEYSRYDFEFTPLGCLISLAIPVLMWFLPRFSLTPGLELVFFFSLLFLVMVPRKPSILPLGAALVYFALHLTRAEGMFLAIAAIPAMLFIQQAKFQGALYTTGTFLACLVVLMLLGSLYNRALTGTADPNVRVGYIVEEFDFVRFVETAADTLTDVIPIMLGPVLMVLLGIGLFAPRDHKGHPREAMALLFLASVQVVASWFVLSPAPRYLMAPLIVLTLWSAAGLVILRDWIGNAALLSGTSNSEQTNPAARELAAPFRRLLPHLPAIALIGFMFLGTARTLGSEFLSDRPRQPVEYKEAGLWMRDNLNPGLVFTRKPQVAYYANMPSTGPLDSDTLDQALTRAREAGAKYLVVDERYAPPALQPLLDPATAPQGLSQLERFEAVPQARVVVYAISN